MKLNCWLTFAALFTTGLLAQQATNSTAPAPIATPGAAPAVTNAAAPATSSTNASTAASAKPKTSKKKSTTASAKKKEAELRTVPLIGGPATVIASNVNVRGQAGLKGEVIGRLTKGQSVTVLEEILLTKSGPDEPSAWAKIQLPSFIHAWVNSTFLEGPTKVVRPRKLNIRGGPGENYSVLGTLKRGDTVTEISAKGDWIEIEAPADAFAFVAAQYLKQEPAPAVVAATPNTTTPPTEPAPTTPTEPAPTPVTVPETTPVVPPTETPVAPAAAETNTPPTTSSDTNTVPAAPPEEEPLPPRIVQREGVVRGTVSIQAPTKFELVSPDNGRPINYLHSTARDLDLRRYKGLRIVVTGEEGLDERWRNTPVITIQRIQVLE
jgi:uncharacterized protein YgiM (DUF1202 family)